MKMRRFVFLIALSFVVLGLGGGPAAPQPDGSAARRVIIFVWDGLRTDDVTPENMPNYFALARSGVVFADHHAVYPTFTMMNSASIATGTYPKRSPILSQRVRRREPFRRPQPHARPYCQIGARKRSASRWDYYGRSAGSPLRRQAQRR